MEKPKQSFGEQAARFSLYAPATAMVIGLSTIGSRDQAGVAVAIGVVNIVLVIAGLILGVVALLSMKRFGHRGILGRAICGVVFNGLILCAIFSLFVPALLVGHTKGKLIGRWRLQSSSSRTNTELTFNKDGSFAFTSLTDGTNTASLEGQWLMTRDRVIGMKIEHVIVGKPSAVGTEMGLGAVESLDEKQLTLRTDAGHESYSRE